MTDSPRAWRMPAPSLSDKTPSMHPHLASLGLLGFVCSFLRYPGVVGMNFHASKWQGGQRRWDHWEMGYHHIWGREKRGVEEQAALSALAAALPRYEWSENSLRSLWEMPPWVIWCYSSHDPCAETSLYHPQNHSLGARAVHGSCRWRRGKHTGPPWTGLASLSGWKA